jgi:hypothetical protein
MADTVLPVPCSPVTDQQLPSGWFPDPLGRYEHRWFNGTTWTSDVATDGQRFVDPLGIAPGPYGAPPARANGAATAALVCGLVGVAIAWIPLLVVVGVVLAVLAIVFGAKGLRQSRESGGGRGRAVTGLVSGIAALALSVVGVILTIGVFREVIAFVEPGPRFVDGVECTVDGREAAVTGQLTNLDDRTRDYVVFVTVDDRTRYAEIDDVAAGETVEWIVRVEGSLDAGSDCDPDVVVNGPFPWGIETDPYRE